MLERVLITGIGMISSIGVNSEKSLESLRTGKSGTGKAVYLDTFHKDTIPVSEVKYSDEELIALSEIKGIPLTRTTLLAWFAAREAFLSAGLDKASRLRGGLISGTSVGGMGKTEKNYLDYLSDNCPPEKRLFIDTHDCGESTQTVADILGFNQFSTTISTACSSAANAIMLGARMIRTGQLDRVIAGGVDSLTKFTINGFNTLMILDRELCKPFDENRQGLNLGEGAGFIVLESEKAAREGNREIFGELKGYANTNDAYHQTASSPEGNGAFMAMSKALEMAGLSTSEIDYINVHGTGTANNDLSEGRAMQKLFADSTPRFSSTKTFTGHTLGAAGGIEAVISLMSIKHQLIFPNMNFNTVMADVSCRPETSLIEKAGIKHVLSNSFGFGGNNSALVFSAI